MKMSSIFNWKDYDNDIHIGKKSKVDNRRYRKRDWAKEYQKRVIAGTANRVKSQQ